MPVGGRRVSVVFRWAVGIDAYGDPSAETDSIRTLRTWASLDGGGARSEVDIDDVADLTRTGVTRLVMRATEVISPETWLMLRGLKVTVRGIDRRVLALEDVDGRRRWWRLTLGA